MSSLAYWQAISVAGSIISCTLYRSDVCLSLAAVCHPALRHSWSNSRHLFGDIPSLVGGYARLLLVSLALAFTAWPLMARYVRGQTLQLKEQQFVEAARTSGTSNIQIILRHIIPNLFSIVIVASTLNIANTIIGEAGISLLGLGVQSPGSSIGLMISMD